MKKIAGCLYKRNRVTKNEKDTISNQDVLEQEKISASLYDTISFSIFLFICYNNHNERGWIDACSEQFIVEG